MLRLSLAGAGLNTCTAREHPQLDGHGSTYCYPSLLPPPLPPSLPSPSRVCVIEKELLQLHRFNRAESLIHEPKVE